MDFNKSLENMKTEWNDLYKDPENRPIKGEVVIIWVRSAPCFARYIEKDIFDVQKTNVFSSFSDLVSLVHTNKWITAPFPPELNEYSFRIYSDDIGTSMPIN